MTGGDDASRSPAPPEGDRPKTSQWEEAGRPKRTAWDEGAPKGRRLSCTLAIIGGLLFLALPVLALLLFWVLPPGIVPGSGFVRLGSDERVAFVGSEVVSGEMVFNITLKEGVADADGLRLACEDVKPALSGFAGADGPRFRVQSWDGRLIATEETPCP
jgi:hypothetical protein